VAAAGAGAAASRVGDTFELRIDADAKAPLSHLPLVVAYNRRSSSRSLGARAAARRRRRGRAAGRRRPRRRLLLGASRLGDRPGVTGTARWR
jgi:hypothetical protein